MSHITRLLHAEAIKLKRSSALRLLIILPLLFLALDFWFFSRSALTLRQLSPEGYLILTAMPLKAVAVLWAGFFHPLMLPLLPACLLQPEHRYKAWKHLQALPVSRRAFFLSKFVVLLVLAGAMLTLAALGLWVTWAFIGRMNPAVAFPFPWASMIRVMAWLLLSSLPLFALYLWLSDRVSHGAVPMVFALIGLMLTISLSGQELDPAWRRDLIPWVLPYVAAQRAVERAEARQDTHIAALPYRREMKIKRIPTSKYGLKVLINFPEEGLPPPPPTPPNVLAAFSLGAGLALLGLGLWESGRNRV